MTNSELNAKRIVKLITIGLMSTIVLAAVHYMTSNEIGFLKSVSDSLWWTPWTLIGALLVFTGLYGWAVLTPNKAPNFGGESN